MSTSTDPHPASYEETPDYLEKAAKAIREALAQTSDPDYREKARLIIERVQRVLEVVAGPGYAGPTMEDVIRETKKKMS